MLSPGVHAVQLAEAAAGVRSAPVSPLGSPAGSPAGRGRGRGRGRRTGGRSRGESPRNGAEAAARGDEARSVPAPEAGLGSEVGFRAHAAASAAPPARDADARRGGGGPEPGDGYGDGKPPAPLFPAVRTPAPYHKLGTSALPQHLITPARESAGGMRCGAAGAMPRCRMPACSAASRLQASRSAGGDPGAPRAQWYALLSDYAAGAPPADPDAFWNAGGAYHAALLEAEVRAAVRGDVAAVAAAHAVLLGALQ